MWRILFLFLNWRTVAVSPRSVNLRRILNLIIQFKFDSSIKCTHSLKAWMHPSISNRTIFAWTFSFINDFAPFYRSTVLPFLSSAFSFILNFVVIVVVCVSVDWFVVIFEVDEMPLTLFWSICIRQIKDIRKFYRFAISFATTSAIDVWEWWTLKANKKKLNIYENWFTSNRW